MKFSVAAPGMVSKTTGNCTGSQDVGNDAESTEEALSRVSHERLESSNDDEGENLSTEDMGREDQSPVSFASPNMSSVRGVLNGINWPHDENSNIFTDIVVSNEICRDINDETNILCAESEAKVIDSGSCDSNRMCHGDMGAAAFVTSRSTSALPTMNLEILPDDLVKSKHDKERMEDSPSVASEGDKSSLHAHDSCVSQLSLTSEKVGPSIDDVAKAVSESHESRVASSGLTFGQDGKMAENKDKKEDFNVKKEEKGFVTGVNLDDYSEFIDQCVSSLGDTPSSAPQEQKSPLDDSASVPNQERRLDKEFNSLRTGLSYGVIAAQSIPNARPSIDQSTQMSHQIDNFREDAVASTATSLVDDNVNAISPQVRERVYEDKNGWLHVETEEIPVPDIKVRTLGPISGCVVPHVNVEKTQEARSMSLQEGRRSHEIYDHNEKDDAADTTPCPDTRIEDASSSSHLSQLHLHTQTSFSDETAMGLPVNERVHGVDRCTPITPGKLSASAHRHSSSSLDGNAVVRPILFQGPAVATLEVRDELGRDSTRAGSSPTVNFGWKRRFYHALAVTMSLISLLVIAIIVATSRRSERTVSSDQRETGTLRPPTPIATSPEEESSNPIDKPFVSQTSLPPSLELFVSIPSLMPSASSSSLSTQTSLRPTLAALETAPSSFPSALPSVLRVEAVRLVIEEISENETLEDEKSPQFRAMVWLAVKDEAKIPIYDSFRLIQRYVLSVLYYSTEGEKWNAQNDFLTGKHECEWSGKDSSGDIRGVEKCDSGLIVTSLDLRSNGLHGTLPRELGLLTNIVRLWLRSNSLTGTIPSELGLLTDLTHLALRSNDMTGSIPSQMGQLIKLRNLWLHDNSLSGPLPTEIGLLTDLETCNLRSNDLTGTVPFTFGNLKSATSIYLHRNEIVGNVDFMCDSLENLITFYVDKNNVKCWCCC